MSSQPSWAVFKCRGGTACAIQRTGCCSWTEPIVESPRFFSLPKPPYRHRKPADSQRRFNPSLVTYNGMIRSDTTANMRGSPETFS